MMERREYGEAVPVYYIRGKKKYIYNSELLEKFRNSKKWLIQTYSESDDEEKHFTINKIYRDEEGNLWLESSRGKNVILYRIY